MANGFLYRAPASRSVPPPVAASDVRAVGVGAPSQTGTVALAGGSQYTITVYFSGAAPAAPSASALQTTLGSNYAVSNVSSSASTITFLLGVVNSITEKTDTFALAVGAPAGSPVTASAPMTVPGASTGTSNAVSTGMVMSTLVITAVVFTIVGWAVEQGLNKAFKKK